RSTYRYSSNVRATPAGRDPIDYFLFDLKEDFCEYFASSMVVMLRELGVPARIVEGFTTGTYDSGLDRYVVKEIDAHAWVEVYFPQYGWIEFEPTPSQAPFARVDSDIVGVGGADGEGGSGANAAREDAEGLGQNELDRGVDDTDLSGSDPISLVRQLDPRPAIAFLALLVLLIALGVAQFHWRFRGLGPVESAWGKTRLLAWRRALDPPLRRFHADGAGRRARDRDDGRADREVARVHRGRQRSGRALLGRLSCRRGPPGGRPRVPHGASGQRGGGEDPDRLRDRRRAPVRARTSLPRGVRPRAR